MARNRIVEIVIVPITINDPMRLAVGGRRA